jgi:hypothetical protein
MKMKKNIIKYKMENANYVNIMNSSMNLMRRMPPKDTLKNLGAVCELILDD